MAGENEKKQDEGRLTSEIRDALGRNLRERDRDSTVPEEGEKVRVALFEKDILWPLRIVGLLQIISFTRELSILLNAGMNLLQSLKALARHTGNEKFRRILRKVSSRVEGGSPMWEALATFPHVFSKTYISTIKAGEMSGKLESTLEVLATHYEQQYSLLHRTRRALFYPIVVIAMVIIVILIMSTKVIPVFASLFSELNVELPPTTRVLIGTNNFLNRYWYLLLIIIAFLVLSHRLLRKTVGGRLLTDRLKLRIPVFGYLHLRMVISRFTRTLAIMLQSGVSILEALSISIETCGDEIVGRQLKKIRQGVEKGETIESCLREPGVFPLLLVDMLVVGEQAGALENVLNRIAEVYEEETSGTISTITMVMEPVLIAVMGVVVAFVFLSLFVPYIKLISAIGNL